MQNKALIKVSHLDFCYGKHQVLHDLDLQIHEHEITALIGPSGCGKSTLLRTFNRICDLVDGARVTRGNITLNGVDLYHPDMDVNALRRQVGMVFQKYNPFPKSIFDNVAYGLEVAGVRDRAEIEHAVEQSLKLASLWDEVKDRLHESALGLSGGQQQRLCIARTICVKPKVILMDEPCAALDPIATAKIEELLHELKKHYTIVIVTHNMEQALRVSDQTAFLYLGKLVEMSPTFELFHNPKNPLTEQYISGKMG